MPQLERERLLEDPLVEQVAQADAQQLTRQTREPADQERDQREHQLIRDVAPHERLRFIGGVRGGLHHRIDDELAHPRHGRGQRGLHQGEGAKEQRVGARGLPDQAECARQLLEELAGGELALGAVGHGDAADSAQAALTPRFIRQAE